MIPRRSLFASLGLALGLSTLAAGSALAQTGATPAPKKTTHKPAKKKVAKKTTHKAAKKPVTNG
jgi:hypothetical protein